MGTLPFCLRTVRALLERQVSSLLLTLGALEVSMHIQIVQVNFANKYHDQIGGSYVNGTMARPADSFCWDNAGFGLCLFLL